MTDDLVARLRAVDHMSVEDCFLQSSLFARAADRLEAAEARVRELEAENTRLRKVVSDCARALGNGAMVAPSASLDFIEMLPGEIAKVLQRAFAEACERCAKVIEDNTISYSNTNCLRPRLDGDTHGMEYAAAIRKLAQEVKHEAE